MVDIPPTIYFNVQGPLASAIDTIRVALIAAGLASNADLLSELRESINRADDEYGLFRLLKCKLYVIGNQGEVFDEEYADYRYYVEIELIPNPTFEYAEIVDALFAALVRAEVKCVVET